MEEKKEQSQLKIIRKKLKVKATQVDEFINAKGTSTKYYLENEFPKNKMFRYLLFLKLNGADLNHFFDKYIKENNIKNNKK